MSIEFPLLTKHTPLGPLNDPKIPVRVRTTDGYRTYRFLIDTGADFSLAPARLALEIGHDWAVLPKTRVTGVEQGSVRARLGVLPLRIQDVDLKVRCLVMVAERPLFILGRADFLDRFTLTIDSWQRKVVLRTQSEMARVK